jgi:hypothetical protein
VADCPSCFLPLQRPPSCIHQANYLEIEAFIATRSIVIEHPEYDWFAHKPADAFSHGHDRYIRISSVAFRIYGWDVLCSCLIHELGHCDLFRENIGEPEDWDEKIRVEQLANDRGRLLIPHHLVPINYQRHREFFLQSYHDRGWSPEKTLSEWSSMLEKLKP